MSNLSYVSADPDSPWQTYLSQVDRVVPYLGPLARWSETLKRPKRTLIVDVPIEMDDGSVAHFEGYRVQHNLSTGPAKGGIRFHQDVTLGEVAALAMWMSWNALWPACHMAAARAALSSTLASFP